MSTGYQDFETFRKENYFYVDKTGCPVIFLSFAGIKGDTYETARGGIVQTIIDLYAGYRFYWKEMR